MSENLIDTIAPHLAPPVSREAIRSAAEHEASADLALPMVPLAPCFADDDAE